MWGEPQERRTVAESLRSHSDGVARAEPEYTPLLRPDVCQNKRRTLMLGAGALVVAAAIAIGVGVGVGLSRGTANARRAAYVLFESCADISAAFGGAAVLSPDQYVQYMTYADDKQTPNPKFPGDYCHYCNCSIPRPPQPEMMEKMGDMIAMSQSATSEAASADKSAGAEDFTGTNNQITDVDEADYVKNDGKFIYMLPRDTMEAQLVIVRAFPVENAAVVSTTDLSQYSFSPRNLLLEGDVLVVVGESWLSDSDRRGKTVGAGPAGAFSMSTVVQQMWDVSNRSAPRLESTVQLEGNYLAARMVDGRAYLVIQTYPTFVPAAASSSSPSQKTLRSASPLFRQLAPGVAGKKQLRAAVGFQALEKGCNRIGRLSGLGDVSTWITVFAMDADKARSTTYGTYKSVTLAGRGHIVYVSAQRIYVASTTYDYQRVSRDQIVKGASPTRDTPKPARGVWSAILAFDLNSGAPAFAGLGVVDGSIINQFAMDEFQGHLRVATTRGEMWATPTTSESLISVLDQDLRPVGLLGGLAPGERIYSVRFMGSRGYVVTYRQVDPFFVFDLSKPGSPQMLGYLKIPGFSDYLHPLDATHMLGVGKDTQEVNGAIMTKGVKLSLFNVADPEKPQEDAVLVLGDSGTSTEVSYEHKAFLYHKSSGVIVLPIDLHQAERCKEPRTEGGACPGFAEWGAPSTFQGAYVLYLEGSDKKRFRVHGRITHEHLAGERNNPTDTGRVMFGLWGGWDWRASLRRVYRSIFMDSLLYTLSDRHLQAHLLSTMEEKAVLNLTMPVCYPAQVYADNGHSNPWVSGPGNLGRRGYSVN